MEKSTAISLGAVAVAAIIAVVVPAARDSKELVPVAEKDIEVAQVLADAETVKTVTCEKKWALEGGVTPKVMWCCDDIGCGSAERAAILNKRAGANGIRVTYTPSEKDDGAVEVGVVITEGAVGEYVEDKARTEARAVAEAAAAAAAKAEADRLAAEEAAKVPAEVVEP